MLRDTGLLDDIYLDRLKGVNIIDLNNNTLLEEKIAHYIGTKYCVTTCNGTSAILLSLISMGLKEGDRVIIPSFSYHAVYTIATYLKLNIVVCDVSTATLCMCPEQLRKLIDPSIKAVLFINHLGYVGEDLVSIKNICDENNVMLFEDSAQGFGHFYNNKSAGTFGEIGIFSFSGTKLLRCGEGGCVVTDNEIYYNKIKELQNLGIGNYILSPLSAKLIEYQLEDIDSILNKRQLIQDKYKEKLNIISSNLLSSIHAVAYISPDADIIYKALNVFGYESRYNFYKSLGLNNSEKIVKEYIELPQSSFICAEDVSSIIKRVESKELSATTIKLISKTKGF